MSTDTRTTAQPTTRYDAAPAGRRRAAALADRLERGAEALVALARELTDEEWKTRIPGNGRKVGVVVHHVGDMYAIEIALAQTLAKGEPIEGVSWNDVHAINAKHAKEHDSVTREAAIAHVHAASAVAAAAVRELTDEQLDRAAPVSLNADAPLTCQFFIEDHAMRHSYHHLAKIRAALGR